MHQFLPWQTDTLDKLLYRNAAEQLPHALLFTGAEGIGKNHFARHFASLLLCQVKNRTQQYEPCGQCQPCKLISADTHPDFRVIESEDGKAIPVDTIRGVGEFLTLKSQLSAMQIVIISPADKLNHFAANSLLKTLEEPTPDTLIILITHRPDSLLPTIRSRCQIVPFLTPPHEQAVTWLSGQYESAESQGNGNKYDTDRLSRVLQIAGGAPLAALDFAQTGALELHDNLQESLEKLFMQGLDPVSEAGKWTEAGVSQALKWLVLWTMEMIRLKSGADLADISNDAVAAGGMGTHDTRLKKISDRIDQKWLFSFFDKLTECSRLLNTQVNPQLMMEDVLIGWARLGKVR